MKNLTPELIAKAKTAKSAEELLALAKANDVELTEAEAKTYFAQLNANCAVSDDELDVVAGGLSCPSDGEDTTANFSLLGKTVKVLNGKRCTKCLSDVGVVGQNLTMTATTDNSMYVTCPKCNTLITYIVSSDNVEVI